MTLEDFIIYHNDEKIENILMTSWVDMLDGYKDICVMVKIVYVDKDGNLRCIEEDAKNFKFLPKIIDHNDNLC